MELGRKGTFFKKIFFPLQFTLDFYHLYKAIDFLIFFVAKRLTLVSFSLHELAGKKALA